MFKLVIDLYFVWDVGHLKTCYPKYFENQTINPYSEELIKILMKMYSFLQNIGLLCSVLIIPKN